MDNRTEEKWASKESTELLNTLTYNNYGLLLNSNSIDMSTTNRLALCTDKAIFILNNNFEWPSALNNSSPFKFFLNNKKSQSQQNKQPIQIDQWIQDLIDSKNDSFFINIIRSVPKSTKYLNIFKQFMTLDEHKQAKHKSFQKQLQFMSKRAINNSSKYSLIFKQPKEISLKCFQEENTEEFVLHKNLFDQTKLFDMDFYEFLSFLNPFSSGQAQENNLQDAFKLCKWNQNSKLHLLFTLTQYNQMLIFDCTRIKFDNTVNNLTSNTSESDTSTPYIKIFDLKSNSKMINLTDFFLSNHNSYLINHRFRNIDDFILNVSKIIPKAITWGPKVYNKDANDYEILLIAFKSNHLGIFYVWSDLKIELNRLIDLNDKLAQDNNDEFVNVDMLKTHKSYITEVTLGENGIILICLCDGRVLLGTLDDAKFEFLNIQNMFGKIKKILHHENLILIQTDNQLGFFLMDNMNLKSTFIYDINETRYSEYLQQSVKNYLTQGQFKLIDFKILSELKFLLIFENGFLDLIEMDIKNDQVVLVKNTVINNTMEINFDPKLSMNQFEFFKSTKQIFLSKNQFILYQINDFTKSSLIQKRPANFQVNVYRLKNIGEKELTEFLYPVGDNESSLIHVNDFIWLFKHDLYLKNDVMFKNIYGLLYENFKTYRQIIGGFKTKEDKLVYLKRLRILAYLVREYFENVSNFDLFNSKIEVDVVDESSEESEYRDEDEIEMEQDIKPDIKQENEESFVKSVSFYDLVFKETSLLIFKYSSIDVIIEAYRLGYENLSADEKTWLILMGDFCVRKNLLQNIESECSSVKLKNGELEKWLEDMSKKSSDAKEFRDALEKIVCDLCGKRFVGDTNLNLRKIKCESGHYMSRCEKTLLPLNNFKYKKCCMCDSKWNYVDIEKGLLKNFNHFFFNRMECCLYCD